MMIGSFASWVAVAALMVVSVWTLRGAGTARAPQRTSALAVACAAAVAMALFALAGGWAESLAGALWLSAAATLAAYGIICWRVEAAWGLLPLVLPMMTAIGLLAALYALDLQPETERAASIGGGWTALHVAASLGTYACLTLAALSAIAALIKERALKARQEGGFAEQLPALADSEWLLFRLLTLGTAILALGVLSGIALNLSGTGTPLSFDHKTLLTVAAFAALVILTLLHGRTGFRGRLAVRIVLAVYVLVSLAYLGVKFVTDVILA